MKLVILEGFLAVIDFTLADLFRQPRLLFCSGSRLPVSLEITPRSRFTKLKFQIDQSRLQTIIRIEITFPESANTGLRKLGPRFDA